LTPESKPSDSLPYEVSINQTATLEILKQLKFAKDCFDEEQYSRALAALDFTRALLPPSIRKKVGEKSSDWYWEHVKAYKATHSRDAWRKVNPEKMWYKDESVDREIEDDARDFMNGELRYHISKVTERYIDALDEANLYIQKPMGGLRATSHNQATEQPPLKKMDPTLPRETTP
jgi:hypothetical protein